MLGAMLKFSPKIRLGMLINVMLIKKKRVSARTGVSRDHRSN